MKEDQASIVALVVSVVFLVAAFFVVAELWKLFLNVFVPAVVAVLAAYYFYRFFHHWLKKK